MDRIDELRSLAARVGPPPPAMDAYLAKVHERAYTVTDADFEALKADFTEDEIFEQTVAAAIAEGLRRLDAGLGVLG